MKTNQAFKRASDSMVVGASVLASLRTEQATINNVREPSTTHPARPMWNAFSELHEMGAEPTVQTARKLAERMDEDVNATIVIFFQWKKFHGV